MKKAAVVLNDGTVFYGLPINEQKTSFGEICFNTGMTGYQEIFTDPSYYGQILILTNVHIGNYGVSDQEMESENVKINALICKNFSYDNYRPSSKSSLETFCQEQSLKVTSDIDTRALVSHIRQNGAMNAAITTELDKIDEILAKVQEYPKMDGLELASKVSTKVPYFYGNKNAKYKVSVVDLGIKKNILRNLESRDVYLKIFPFNAKFEEVSAWNPDGYFISNGPGDPKPLYEARNLAKILIEKKLPLFGICLGHQVIALAKNIKTYKMFNGHRGINHPVLDLKTGKGLITTQNHGFAIDKSQTEKHPDVKISHLHLNDDTVAGIRLTNNICFSVQFHPEAAPGPSDSTYLFNEFINLFKH